MSRRRDWVDHDRNGSGIRLSPSSSHPVDSVTLSHLQTLANVRKTEAGPCTSRRPSSRAGTHLPNKAQASLLEVAAPVDSQHQHEKPLRPSCLQKAATTGTQRVLKDPQQNQHNPAPAPSSNSLTHKIMGN